MPGTTRLIECQRNLTRSAGFIVGGNAAGDLTMEIRPTICSRALRRSTWGRTVVAILLSGFVLAGQPVVARTVLDTPTFPSQGDLSPRAQATPDQTGLKQIVKIIVEPGTNRILLVGTKQDVAVVLRTLESLKEKLNSNSDPTVTEKIVLESQLADTVASLMSRSLGVHNPRGPEVRIDPVHFPEAILLSGPASAVKRARQLLATIDRYEGLSESDGCEPKHVY